LRGTELNRRPQGY